MPDKKASLVEEDQKVGERQKVEESQNTSNLSQANSLPATIDMLSPSPKSSVPSPQFKLPQPLPLADDLPGPSGLSRHTDKENRPPSVSSSNSSTSPNRTSPIIRSSNLNRSHFHSQSQYGSPQPSRGLIQDHLSPRLGLMHSTVPVSAISLERFNHAKPYPPARPIGDLNGTMPLFLEMRPFSHRPTNSTTPERNQRERGCKYIRIIYNVTLYIIDYKFFFRLVYWCLLCQ